MATISKLRADIEDNLQEQIASLTREVASLKKSLAKRGASAYADGRESAADLYDEMRERLADALPVMRDRAKAVEKVARDNPATAAAVGLVVVGLVVALLARR